LRVFFCDALSCAAKGNRNSRQLSSASFDLSTPQPRHLIERQGMHTPTLKVRQNDNSIATSMNTQQQE